MKYHTLNSKKLQKLRKEPQIDISLPSGGPTRSKIHRFHIYSGGNGPGKGREIENNQIRTVYYLIGDERRAIRKFIKVNSKFVKDCMSDECNNPVSNSLDGTLFDIFKEEYEFMEYHDEI